MYRKYQYKLHWCAALMLLCVVLVLASSLIFITVHADHDCAGAHCDVCCHLQLAATVLRTFAAVGFFVLSAILYAPVFLRLVKAAARQINFSLTLVALRVRIND